jgi:ribonucleoside-diphosphate reductase alpha chain
VAIGKALIDMWKEVNNGNCNVNLHSGNADATVPVSREGGVKCPECGAPLIFEGGCNSCKNCGFSKCD